MGKNRNFLLEAEKEFARYRLLGLLSLERMTTEQLFRAQGSQGHTAAIIVQHLNGSMPRLKDGCHHRFPKEAPRHTIKPWPVDIPLPFDRPKEGALFA
jgi:hypothetical protein